MDAAGSGRVAHPCGLGKGGFFLFSRPSPIVRITSKYNYSLDLIPVSCILTVFLHLGGEEAGSPLSAQLARRLPSFRYLFTSLFHYFAPASPRLPQNPLKGSLQ
jgi:hypothetical protein